jgi:ankyrin repeat protein
LILIEGGAMKAMLSTISACFLLLCVPSIQAQETDIQEMLMDSVAKLDIAGVKTALDKGANPNWAPDRGQSVLGGLSTALLSSSEKTEQKRVEILKMLFSAGAKFQPRDQWSLGFPIGEGWAVFTELLLKNGASATKECQGRTPIEIAVDYEQMGIIELLIKYGASALEKQIAAQRRLIAAAGRRDKPVMEEAIRNGAYVNAPNRQGEIALNEALALPPYNAEDYAAIQYLLEKGANPANQDHDTWTALHCAILSSSRIFESKWSTDEARTNAKLTIESLLSHGALVSARDSNGLTPLHIAAQKNNVVGAKILIEAGSKIMPKDNKGKTPLDYAESAEMIKLLKDHGAQEK